MRAYIATNILGSFAFDKDGKILEQRLFPKRPEEIAMELEKAKKGEILQYEKEIINKLYKAGVKEIICDRPVNISGIICDVKKENLGTQTLQSEFRRLAIELKWVSSQAELNEILTKVNVLLTKEKLKVVKSDRIIMHTIGVIDELDRGLNVFSERLREWYGLYFPEATKMIESNEKLADLVANYANKERIKMEYKDKNVVKQIENSAGMNFSEYDLENIQNYAKPILNLFETKKYLTDYLEKLAKEVIPNMTALSGSLLASRLLAQAGGLEKISRLSSSTIQLLGAEKALFRHLRGEGKAPKYGVLFAHPYIQQAPNELKGKVARLIASKLSIAARIDFFSKEDRGSQLKKDLEEHLNKILAHPVS